MMLPTRKPERSYQTLEDIRQRKEELAQDIQNDNRRFGQLWNETFVLQKDGSKGEWVSSLIANSVTAVDTFLLVRKLVKNYGHLLGLRKKKR